MNPNTLIQWFERSVAAFPDAIAIDFGDSHVSYAELDRAARRRASHLATLGLPPRSRVGLLADPVVGTYASYLAILRLGHAVVPMRPDNPVEYQHDITAAAGVAAVMLNPREHDELATQLSQAGIATVDHDTETDEEAPARNVRPEDVAYILFTSGSSGRPKGVAIQHRNVASYLSHVVPRYELQPGDRASHTFALTFDPSVFDLFGTWSCGATLVVPRNRELLAPATFVSSRGITHWYSVPALAAHAEAIGDLEPGSMPGLRFSRFIGEPLPRRVAEQWQCAAPECGIDNVYGPTELTISCAEYRLDRNTSVWPETRNNSIPIGSIYPKLEAIIIDSDGRLSDEGELCVRGPQRFSGYLDPSDNAGRFVEVSADTARRLPHGGTVTDAHWYCTGDRVQRHNEYIVHLGRIDRQVKIQGHRIELGEVEGAIRSCPGVIDAAVLALPDGHDGRQLVAAVRSDPAKTADTSRCRRFLASHKPGYMIPRRIVVMPSFPRNGSGKTDYLALQDLLSDTKGAGIR